MIKMVCKKCLDKGWIYDAVVGVDKDGQEIQEDIECDCGAFEKKVLKNEV